MRKFHGRGISTFIDYSIVVIQVSHESIDTLSTALFVDKKIPHGNRIFFKLSWVPHAEETGDSRPLPPCDNCIKSK